MTNDQKNKEMCQLLGIPWHAPRPNPQGKIGENRCMCGKMYITTKELRFHVSQREDENPNFIIDPVSLLKELKKREDWEAFIYFKHDGYDPLKYCFEDYLLDQTGKLLDLALEWMRKEKKP